MEQTAIVEEVLEVASQSGKNTKVLAYAAGVSVVILGGVMIYKKLKKNKTIEVVTEEIQED